MSARVSWAGAVSGPWVGCAVGKTGCEEINGLWVDSGYL